MPRTRIGPDELSIAQLEKILEKRRSKLSKLEKQRRKLQQELDELDSTILGLGGAGGRRNGRAHNAKSLPQTLVEVLTRHGPTKVGDIVKAVLATGYKTNSDNFRSIVNQQLIKDKRFTAASRGVYQLKK
jgi:hypothetical protein